MSLHCFRRLINPLNGIPDRWLVFRLAAKLVANETNSEGTLFGRGEVRAAGSAVDFYRKLHSVLGTFLQVKSLSLLIGAGPSYALGAPRIRAMNRQDILQMIDASGEGSDLPQPGKELLEQFVEGGGGSADLEAILSTLTAALAVTRGVGGSHVLRLGELELNAEDLLQTRRVINHALALGCALPNANRIDDEELLQDPLRHHRVFFQKLLRARRLGLPRLRIFTTNYDLVIEKALDDSRIAYFDGFIGTLDRRFHPESFGQDLYLPTETGDRRLLRVQDVVYLYKLHGSIAWRAKSPTGGGPKEVVESHPAASFQGDELALIFPTPQKEADSLGYPYSALFRSFSECLQAEDGALITIGYGFADDHINRLIYQALGNPSFQLFVVVPSGVVHWANGQREGQAQSSGDTNMEFLPGILGSLARTADARVHVLTGSVAGTFEDLASNGLPETTDIATEEIAEQTQTSLASTFFRDTDRADE